MAIVLGRALSYVIFPSSLVPVFLEQLRAIDAPSQIPILSPSCQCFLYLPQYSHLASSSSLPAHPQGALPSELLLLLKTNDCLRHIDKQLDTPVNSAAGTNIPCTNVLCIKHCHVMSFPSLLKRCSLSIIYR
jgi:hypothetical protein